MSNNQLTYTQRFIKDHPICCFCGGGTPATTRDHVPAKTIFDGKRRPKGLEVPACVQCQEFTKKHELVVSMLIRLYPEPTTFEQRQEINNIVLRACSAVPGLADEIQAKPDQEAKLKEIVKLKPGAAGMLDAGGPLINTSLDIFSVKMTCALHYEITKKILSTRKPISIQVFTNVNILDDKIPKEMLNAMGPSNTIQQGKWSVQDQFSYWNVTDFDHEIGAYYSTFRESFAVFGMVWKDMDHLPEGEGMKTFVTQTTGEFLRIK